MANSNKHGKQTLSQGIHGTIAYEYPNATARLADTDFEPEDLYKQAIQLDDNSIWILYSISPPLWSPVGSNPTAVQAISAGATQAPGPVIAFSNANGVSFGANGSTITASVQPSGLAGIQAGTNTVTSGTLLFSNANSVTFGIAGSVLTASILPGAAAGLGGVQAGTQTQTSGTLVFVNSNGATFGMSNSSQITISYTVPSTAGLISNINVSAGTTSNNLSAITFSNSNSVSFGLDGSVITASINAPAQTIQTQNVVVPSAGGSTATSGTVVFSNSNGLSFSLNGSIITGSYTVPNTAGLLSNIKISAGTQSSNLSALTFSNSNGLSFGLDNGTITASFSQSVQTQSNVQGISAGTQVGRTGDIVFSNSNGISFGMSGSNTVTASYTVPSTAGLISNINVSAGTTSNNLSALTFSNSNGLSFGLNGSTITGSYTVPTQTNQTAGLYAVGNTTGQSSSSTFDARSISFSGAGIASVGYSGGNVIISVSSANGNINVSAGTTSNNLSNLTFADGNGVSFGLNASTLTASVSQSNQTLGFFVSSNTTLNSSTTFDARSVTFNAVGAVTMGFFNSKVQVSVNPQTNQTVGLYALGNTTQNSSTTLDARTLSFNGLGGMTVGYSNGSIQLSAPVAQTAQTQNVVVPSAGTQTATSGTVVFSNSNGISFGMSGSSQITASYTVPSTAGLISNINVSAGTTSNNLSAITFSNSNGLAFGLNGSTITGSYTVPTQSNQTQGFYAVGNTAGQSSSTTIDARSITFNGSGGISVGYSNGSVVLSVNTAGGGALTNINVSAGTTSNNLSALTFSNVNNVSFGLNASTITASASFPAQTNQTVGLYALGNTTQNSSTTLDARTLSFNGLGDITVGYSNGSIQISGSQTVQTQNVVVPSAGTQTATSGTVVFSNSNGISFGMSGSSRITASYTVPSTAGLISAINVSAGTTSNNLSAITFSNINGISFGLDASTITASYTVPTQTNQTVGLYALGNTTQNSSTTLDARSLSFNGLGAATVGYSNGSIQISVPVQTVQTQSNIQAIYDGANSISTGTIRFSNSNGITFGINGQTLTASHNGITSQTNQTVGLYALGNTTQNSSTTLDARTLSFNGLGDITVGYSNGSIQVSGSQTAQTQNVVVPSAGTQTATSGTVVFSNSNGISFGMSGSSRITASYTVPSTAGLISAINVSAGTTSNNLSAITFSNSNGLAFGLNGSTITGSYTVPTQTNQTIGLYAVGNTTQNSSTTLDARTLSFNGLGVATVGYSNGSIQISAGAKLSQLIHPINPWQTNFTVSNASFSLQHFNAYANITASQANLLMDLSGNTNSSGALTISIGIYTMAGSTMSLASSDSRQISWTSGSQTSASSLFGGISGTRYRTIPLANWSISAGDYMLGIWFRTTNNGTWKAFGQQGPTIVGAVDVNETNHYNNGYSTSSFTTAMIASINVTNTNYVRTGANALQQPGIIFLGSF